MRREEKEAMVKDLRQVIIDAKGLILLSCRGIGAQEMGRMRKRLTEAGCTMRVVKNTLFRLALQDTAATPVLDHVAGPIALITCGPDIPTSVKELLNLESETPAFQVKTAFLGGAIRESRELREISNLPPIPDLAAKVAFLLRSPVSNLIQTLQHPIRNLISVLNAAAETAEGKA